MELLASSQKNRSPMKVALIMGALCHARISHLYEGFDPRYEIIAVGSKKCDIGESDIKQEHRRILTLRDILRHVPKLRHRIPWETQQYFFGFEKAMSDIGILYPAGSAMKFAYQCIQMKRKTGVKVVVSDFENVPLRFFHHSETRRAERLAVLHEADAIVAVLHQVKTCLLMEGIPEEKIHVIYHGVNTEKFHPAPKSKDMLGILGLSERDIAVLFIGHFGWQKGALTYLYAAKLLEMDSEVRDFPVKFIVVARGGKDFTKRAEYLGIADRVVIHERIPFEKMPQLYRCADIVVVPSIPIFQAYEQTSNVTHEAAACGRALVLSYTGGLPELMGDDALYFAPADYQGLYKNLKELILDEKKREEYGRRARCRATEVLDSAIMREKTARLFDQVLG
ncbi:MAG: glycosyltransferase family 4 protein [Armatimonadota bacterium]|nr:glycosyltransferase family 4 protein [Armatimonadota bacterium]